MTHRSESRMSENVKLAELEEAFEKKDLEYFKALMGKSKGLPFLLRVHSVCMLEVIIALRGRI